MFCFHKWLAPVDRQQACKKCGAVRSVACVHNWENLEEAKTRGYFEPLDRGNVVQIKIRRRCTLCGHEEIFNLEG